MFDTYLGHDITPSSANFMLEGLCSITIFIFKEGIKMF